MPTTLLSSSSLTGDDVRNAQGEDLGNIKDIMIDTKTGRVEYYVLSFGGILVMGNKLFAVPPQALSIDHENECMICQIDQERLENAPGFDQDDWPNMADQSFRDQIYNHYGYEQDTTDYRTAA
jgi:sporulation protein YlmC with PRC-barrel domain